MNTLAFQTSTTGTTGITVTALSFLSQGKLATRCRENMLGRATGIRTTHMQMCEHTDVAEVC